MAKTVTSNFWFGIIDFMIMGMMTKWGKRKGETEREKLRPKAEPFY